MFLTGAACLLAGCIKDETVSATDGGELVDMQLSITRSAANSNGEATGAEMDVKDIYVYILDADGNLENPGEIRVDASPLLTSVDSSTDLINKKWRVKRGMKNIYVVLNGERSMNMTYPDKFTYENDAYPFIQTSFIEANQPATSPKWLTFDYGSHTVNVSCKVIEWDMVSALNRYTDFKVMSGYTENFLADQIGGVCKTTIPVSRRYAAVELHLRKSADMPDTTVVKVKQIRYRHFSSYTSIFSPVPYDPQAHVDGDRNQSDADRGDNCYLAVKADEATVENAQKVTAKAPGTQYTQMKVWTFSETNNMDKGNPPPALNPKRFYVYPRTKETSLSDAGVPTIEIVADINGKEKVYTAYVSELDEDGKCDKTKPIDILGNHIYRIQATLSPDTATVQLNILDWTDQAVDGDILGTDFTVSKSLVAMDWWNLGESYATSVDLSASENITFEKYESNGKTFTDNSMLPAWLRVGIPTLSSKSAHVTLDYSIDTAAVKYPVYLWFKAGNIRKKVEVVYDNGLLPSDLLKQGEGGWSLPSSVKGIHLAKKGNQYPTATADDNYDNECMKWANTSKSVPFAQNEGFGFGPFNTTVIMDALGTAATAAMSCRSLGSDWYLGSANESFVVASEFLQNSLGESYKMKTGAFDNYYTSSEVPGDGSLVYTVLPSIYWQQLQQGKLEKYYVRAMTTVGKEYKVTMQKDMPIAVSDDVVSLQGGGSYKAGSVVRISYRNNTLYSFVKFIPSVDSVDIIHLADDLAYFVMPEKDITITARFVATEWKPDMSGWAEGDLIVKDVGGEIQLTIGTAADVGPAFKWGSLIGLGISDNQVKFTPEEYKGTATNVQTAPVPTISCDGDPTTNHLLAVHDPEAGTEIFACTPVENGRRISITRFGACRPGPNWNRSLEIGFQEEILRFSVRPTGMYPFT